MNGADSTALKEEAAHWVVQLHDTDPWTCEAERRAREDRHGQFIRWLQRSEAHVVAFLHADARFCELSGVDPHHRLDLSRLMRAQTGDLDLLRVLPASAPRRMTGPMRQRTYAALAVTVLMAAIGILSMRFVLHTNIYTTGIGEQRAVKLADGSTMQLNTQSRAEVNFSVTERQIRLLKGEALFNVGRDAHRPFLVVTPTATVRALGTQFDVYACPNATTKVSVIEGIVQVATPNPIRLVAGETAQVSRYSVKREKARVDDAILWRERLLAFHGQTLSEVAAEFNRYNAQKVLVEDPAIDERRLSGTFNADQPQMLIKYLEKDDSLSIMSRSGGWVIHGR